MSAKYQRVKQADLTLPAPLRWLTRAFSSITLAVILLALISIYGVLGSVPVKLLALGGLYLAAIVITLGPASLLSYGLVRSPRLPKPLRIAAPILLFGAAVFAAIGLCIASYHWVSVNHFLQTHRATVIYRLPAFEMTMLEFFAWWPMRLLLVLFVINMVWATIRRIEFRFMNLGVLTVHAGIVVMAIGSMFYGYFKLEGDTILWRRDLGGTFENVVYSSSQPALYVTVGRADLMLPLSDLPRYNDYPLGTLDIRLHEMPGFRERFGEHVRMTIPGFLAWADLHPHWVPVPEGEDPPPDAHLSPGLRLTPGDSSGPRPTAATMTLLADVPAQRVIERTAWSIEYLVNPDPQRLTDLTTRFDGAHGLIVEIPAHDFRQVYPIEPGQTITAGDTGYTLTVRDIGAYDMPFVTAGYRGTQDTRAVVEVRGPEGKQFTRITLHRYPERSQDFVPAPDDPSVGPMGRRTDPDPAVRLVYLDNSRPQYHVVAPSPDAAPEALSFIVRLPGSPPMVAPVDGGRIPVPGAGDEGLSWLHVTGQLPRMMRIMEPVPTPKRLRDPEDEGLYLHSLLPVQIEVDLPEDQGGGTWSELVWLYHMRYPKYPDETHRPETLNVPTLGPVSLSFSRVRYELPFAIALEAFEMQPYPGSDIPKDFVARLLIADLDEQGRMLHEPREYVAHMNNPVIYRAEHAPLGLSKLKLSQTGWDPPDPQDPQAKARDAQGRFLNQQRFTVLGVGNNVGIRIIALGAILVAVGIPWAFYVKPLLLRRQKQRIQRQLADGTYQPPRRRETDAVPAPAGAVNGSNGQPPGEPAPTDHDDAPSKHTPLRV